MPGMRDLGLELRLIALFRPGSEGMLTVNDDASLLSQARAPAFAGVLSGLVRVCSFVSLPL